MSGESPSELPVHYGEVTKDGTRVERPSEDTRGHRSSHDDGAPLVKKLPLDQQSSVSPIHDLNLADTLDDPRSSRVTIHQRSRSRPLTGLDFSKPNMGRDYSRRSAADRRRYDDYERYDDDEEYEPQPQYKPRRIADRAYFPEEEYYEPRRRPSYATRPPPERRRRSIDYEEEAPPPRRHNSTRIARTARGPSTVEEEDDGEDYPMDRSPPPKGKRQLQLSDLTPEERKDIMRLPWTQWMNSDLKNREYCQNVAAQALND